MHTAAGVYVNMSLAKTQAVVAGRTGSPVSTAARFAVRDICFIYILVKLLGMYSLTNLLKFS